MATQTMTTASITMSAGSSRRALRTQKSAEPEAPGSAPMFEQQVGDQIAAQREEHADAEQPALGPTDVQVVDDDGDDREGPEAVEAGDVSMPRFDWLRHSGRPPEDAATWRAARSRGRPRPALLGDGPGVADEATHHGGTG